MHHGGLWVLEAAEGVAEVSYAYRCEVCARPPLWRVERRGDAVISWACMDPGHLVSVLYGLQRFDRPHPTELIVTMPRHGY